MCFLSNLLIPQSAPGTKPFLKVHVLTHVGQLGNYKNYNYNTEFLKNYEKFSNISNVLGMAIY